MFHVTDFGTPGRKGEDGIPLEHGVVAVADALTGSSVVVPTNELVAADLGGEVAILNLRSGTYYGLNPVGVQIWTLIQTPRTVNEIRDLLLQDYAVEPDRCERELFALLRKLESEGLVEFRQA
jgi:Coenzyme PQQ synthesis protein D (PqqD)